MAYDIPVAALILDHPTAAAAIGETPDYFNNETNDRYEGVEKLTQLTNAPIEYFASEDDSIYYIGLQIYSDWCIEINPSLLAKAAALKTQYQHPLIQAAKLAVVNDFN